MKQGHVTGTKTEKANSQDWYAAIAESRIAELEAAQRTAEMAEQALVAALAKQIGNAISAIPEAAERIRNAAKLVQAQDVWPLSSGAYLVGSQSDGLAAHLVSRGPWACDCRWAQTGHSLCSHQLAVMLVIKMGAAYTPRYT